MFQLKCDHWPLMGVIYLIHDRLDLAYPNLKDFFSRFLVHNRLDLTHKFK